MLAGHRALPEPVSRLGLGLCLSGGADSCALALAAGPLRAHAGGDVVGLHACHGLRGSASEGDRLSVRELCARLALPLIEVDAAVAPGPNLEERARRVRYRKLRESFPGVLVTAHHRGDQAETVVLRLLRGAGATGLRGIHPLRDDLVWRPLLDQPGADLRQACREAGWAWREDASNTDLSLTRNWVRHAWLPAQPEGTEAALCELARAAERLAPALGARLDRLAERLGLELLEDGFRLDLSALSSGTFPDPELDLLLERTWTRLGRRPWAGQQRARLLADAASGRVGRRRGGQGEIALWGGSTLQIRAETSADG